MPDIFAVLRDLVWTAVGAVVMGVLSVAAALAGASLETVGSLGVFGIIFAVLSLRR